MASQLLKTVMPSGGDYTSLEACMNANEQNLVTADKYFDVEIDGTWSSADTSAVTIHNYTTDATRYINIYTTSAARHVGVWSTSYYMLNPTGNNHKIQISGNTTPYITIDGLQIFNQATGDVYGGINVDGYTSGVLIIKSNIIKSSSSYTTIRGIRLVANTNSTINVFNNIIYGFIGSNAVGFWSQVSCFLYNNTVYDCSTGILSYSIDLGVLAKNNISYNNGTDYSIPVGGRWALASTNNLSKDTTAIPYNIYYISKTLTFTNTGAGTEDFHLVSTDTDAIDKGADLSGTFTDDIDGVTRTGTWDIGADEYVSGAPPSATPRGYLSTMKGYW